MKRAIVIFLLAALTAAASPVAPKPKEPTRSVDTWDLYPELRPTFFRTVRLCWFVLLLP